MNDVLLRAENLSKRYPGTLALDSVSIDIKSGEIHSIVGENGAGKSTLMKILGGVIQSDTGRIIINGQKVKNLDILKAQDMGVSMVHQELSVIPNLSIAENVFANRQPDGPGGLIKWEELYEKTEELLSLFDYDMSANTMVKNLSTANQQMVEILRAISIDSKILILDEPTSALGYDDTEKLHNNLKRLKEKGVGIFYISHKIPHVLDISDRITVLRDGKHSGTLTGKEATEDKIVNKMVGRKLAVEQFEKAESTGDVLLEIENFAGKGFEDIDFQLREGEVLGFFGLVGSGRTELACSIYGDNKKETGEIKIKGTKVEIDSPRDALDNKLGYLPEDRKEQGLFLNMNLRENTVVSILRRLSANGIMKSEKEKDLSEEIIETLAIKTSGIDQKVKYLSGGNQQKVLFGHWLATTPDILIVDEPTRGVDVGTKHQIHDLLRSEMDKGVGIIVISSDLPEVLTVCDRVIVMHEGKIVANLSTIGLEEKEVMNYATGRIK